MSYKTHVFVCENRREDGRRCCALRGCGGNEGSDSGGADVIDGGAVKFLRDLLKAGGHHGKGRVRVNRAGCFDRCDEGPALVVYPAGRWFRYENAEDLREIAERVILADGTVERLEI